MFTTCLRPGDHNAGREHGQRDCDCLYDLSKRHAADLVRTRGGVATDATSGDATHTDGDSMSISDSDVDFEHRFGYHPPSTPAIIKAHEDVRDEFRVAAEYICEVIPPCRERATALTKLEEAMFWANAGVARNMNGGQ